MIRSTGLVVLRGSWRHSSSAWTARPTLVGHDWGGGLVVRVVSTRPELVRSWATNIALRLGDDSAADTARRIINGFLAPC